MTTRPHEEKTMRNSPHRVSDVMTGAVVAVGRKILFEDIIERMEQ
jgi:hypothetical protein